jgi:hypothetical protein
LFESLGGWERGAFRVEQVGHMFWIIWREDLPSSARVPAAGTLAA